MQSQGISSKIRHWISGPEHRFQAVVWLLTIALYYPIFKALYGSRWDNIDYSHAYFILPVALFMAWRALLDARNRQRATSAGPNLDLNVERCALRVGPAKNSYLFASLFVFGLLLFIFGWRQDYLSLSTFALIPILYGLTGWLYGPQVVRVLWFPIAYLLLLVPPPLGVLDSITLPMRYGVSIVTQHLVGMLGYPITRDGLLLKIGGHDVFLGEACSGFRSLITLSSLGLAYIFLSKCTRPRKFWMTAAIVPLSLLGNLVRVIGVVIVTYYWGESLGQRFFHDASGFVMFVVMLAGLLGIENFNVARHPSLVDRRNTNDGQRRMKP